MVRVIRERRSVRHPSDAPLCTVAVGGARDRVVIPWHPAVVELRSNLPSVVPWPQLRTVSTGGMWEGVFLSPLSPYYVCSTLGPVGLPT